MRNVRIATLMVGCLMLCSMAASAEQIANPQYEQWKKFKVGTWTKVQMDNQANGMAMKIETTTKLVELTDDHATLEITSAMTMAGNAMPANTSKMDIKSMMDKPAEVAGADKPDVKEGEEDVKVGDTTYKCKTTETTTKAGANTTVSKVWTCAEVPGYVKMTSTTEGQAKMQMTAMLVGFEAGK